MHESILDKKIKLAELQAPSGPQTHTFTKQYKQSHVECKELHTFTERIREILEIILNPTSTFFSSGEEEDCRQDYTK